MIGKNVQWFYVFILIVGILIFIGFKTKIISSINWNNLFANKNPNDNEAIKNTNPLSLIDYKYWSEKVDNSDEIIMSIEDIQMFNQENTELNDDLIDIEKLPDTISKGILMELIEKLSIIPKSVRFDHNGNEISDEFYSGLINNMAISNIEEINPLRYGITTKRTVLRTFPTYVSVYSSKGDIEFDRFMETAIYTLEPVTIYLESQDGEWIFGSIYNYSGWIPKVDIAIGQKEEIFGILNSSEFLVVTSPQIIIDDVIFDMGVKIPLKEVKENSYLIYIPVVDKKVVYKILEISKSEDYNLGYLPYTKDNLLKQGFKLYGEPYGWGGMNNTRDCSSFIMDIHRTFGLQLPRNTGQQALNSLGQNYDFKEADLEAKLEILDSMPIGTAIYMPGHTMLYIGKDNGIHYMIHQYAGHYENNGNTLVYIEAMKTDITPVTIKTSTGVTYLERVYVGKEFKR